MAPPSDSSPGEDDLGAGGRLRRRLRRPGRAQLLGGAVLLFLAISTVLLLTDPGEEEPSGATGVTTALAAAPARDGAAAAGAAVALDPTGAACLGFGRLLTRRSSGVNAGDRGALEALKEEAALLPAPLDVAGAHLAEAARLGRSSIELGRAGEGARATDTFLLGRLAEAEAVAAARAQGCSGERVALPRASPTPRPARDEGAQLLDVLRDTYRSRADGVAPTDPDARAQLYVELGATASGMDAAVAETACRVGFLNNLVSRADDALTGYIVFVSILDVCIDVGAVDDRIGRSEFRGG